MGSTRGSHSPEHSEPAFDLLVALNGSATAASARQQHWQPNCRIMIRSAVRFAESNNTENLFGYHRYNILNSIFMNSCLESANQTLQSKFVVWNVWKTCSTSSGAEDLGEFCRCVLPANFRRTCGDVALRCGHVAIWHQWWPVYRCHCGLKCHGCETLAERHSHVGRACFCSSGRDNSVVLASFLKRCNISELQC